MGATAINQREITESFVCPAISETTLSLGKHSLTTILTHTPNEKIAINTNKYVRYALRFPGLASAWTFLEIHCEGAHEGGKLEALEWRYPLRKI